MVENFGLYLKHERELRGVPLEEIAEVTKIHIRFLEALENNEFERLPGEVFIKGYIRSYAKVIGFDSEEMVNAYDETVGKDRKEEFEQARLANEIIRSRKKTLAGYVIGGVALVGVIIMGYSGVRSVVEEGKKDRTELLSVSDPSFKIVEPENISKTEPPQEEPIKNNEGNSGQELEADFLQDAPASSPVDSKTKLDPNEKIARSPAVPQTIPEPPQPEIEKTKNVTTDPLLKMKPSTPPEEKKEKPETPIKPAEIEKTSDSSEKPVIIQHVVEKPQEADSGPELSESDSKRLHLMIRVQGNSWFNVTVDDDKEEDFILPSGSRKNIYGSEKFRITLGNRRETQLFLNGQPIDLPIGTNDVIRDFDITAKLIE